MPKADTTRALAEFVSDLKYEELPLGVRIRVKEIVLDTCASALAGHDADEVGQIAALARGLGDSEEASVIGGERLSIAGATIVNSYLITAVSVCDIHRASFCHVTPEVVAPALVTAESLGISGRHFLAAVAAGLEVTTRIGLGLGPKAFRARGWHAPGVTGPFGGAAAVGKILGLSASQQCSAFGLAGSQAAGTFAHMGTPTIKFQQSRGALSGLLSGHLASQGFTAAQDILTNPDGGLFSTYTDDGRPEAVRDGLGVDWELMRISLRAWPVAAHLQPVVTGLLDFVLSQDFDPSELVAVSVRLPESAYNMHGTIDWRNRFRARLSAPYVVGVVIQDRRCWLDQFTATRVQDPLLGRFIRERVHIDSDATVPEGTAKISITNGRGETRTLNVTKAKGEPSNPLTTDELAEKFRSAAALLLAPTAITDVLDMVSELEEVPNMGRLSDRLRRSA